MRKNDRAEEVYKRLQKRYPDAHCELDHQNAYQLLVATILSAQCTDVRVNMVTPGLFKKYPSPAKLATAPLDQVEEAIKSINFFRNKAKSLVGMAKSLVGEYAGHVPDSMEELIKLPGVGRKTANVVLGNAFNKPIGIVVDTHVMRLSNLLGLTKQHDPVKVEHDLIKLFPREQWTMLSHLLIFHGRRVCIARRPQCDLCPLNDICPSAKLTDKPHAKKK